MGGPVPGQSRVGRQAPPGRHHAGQPVPAAHADRVGPGGSADQGQLLRRPVPADRPPPGSEQGRRRGRPQPEEARFRVVTPGALVATLLWLIASGLFAVYTANFASYSKTYGSLASIVVVLLWLYVSAIAVLIGAEIDGLSRTASSTRR
ncbi:MAG TPA: YhjD/YihY/BrkB family envelope integrity protein [Streptosporangiaceae bacterium]|nr:YhjD/YihY/BrkB family envelope integrity protein [Streptosporangiaceae bacterium]